MAVEFRSGQRLVLVKCRACSRDISSDTKTCPHCGHRHTTFAAAGITIIFLVLFGWWVISYINSVNGPSGPAPGSEDPLTAGGQKVKKGHGGWSNAACNSIAAKEIRVGMTAEQVRASWGKPSRINERVTQHAQSEQWVYSGGTYLYFDDGKLRSWQSSRSR